MRRLLIGAALLATVIDCVAETKQALTLFMESGGEIVYFLDMEPTISFEGQNMVVKVANDSRDIPLNQVNRWEIGLAEYSGAGMNNCVGGTRITVFGNTVTVYNPAGGDTAIYNLSGQTYGTSSLQESSFSLPKGIYLVKLGNKSYKIAVR